MTIYRRRQEYGIPSTGGRAISDIQLREHLHQLQQDLPSLGQTLVWGRIRSMDLLRYKCTIVRKKNREDMLQ